MQKAAERQETLREVRILRRQLREHGSFGRIIGNTPAIRQIYRIIEQAAPTAASVLIWGESGTGKEMVAQTIHQLSQRATQAFVPINCAAIPETLLESEIFGHEKGAFTGAVERRQGCFELAHRGTLFLDEIAEMMPATQVKLLRVLQERKFRRLGGRQEQEVDVRIIAATNVDPVEAVRQRQAARGPLLPPQRLHDRAAAAARSPEDIPLLVQAFLNEFNARNGKAVKGVDQDAMRLLEHYSWPGNIRELRNVIERATILAGGDLIEPAAPAADADPRQEGRSGVDRAADAGHDRRRGRDAADPADARAHARQQDAGRRDPRHQPEDAAQQAESPEGAGSGAAPPPERQRRRVGARSQGPTVVEPRVAMRSASRRNRSPGSCSSSALAVIVLSAIYTALDRRRALHRDAVARRDAAQFVFERASASSPRARTPTRRCSATAACARCSSRRMAYSRHVTYAALVDPRNVVIVHSSPVLEGQVLEPQPLLEPLLSEDPWTRSRRSRPTARSRSASGCCSASEGENEFGTIRIGISTALIWEDLLQDDADGGPRRPGGARRCATLRRAAAGAVDAAAGARAEERLRPPRPRRVRRQAGSAARRRVQRAGRLVQQAVAPSCRRCDRSWRPDQAAPVESVVDRLEDAVAMVNPDGQVRVRQRRDPQRRCPRPSAGSKLHARGRELHPYRATRRAGAGDAAVGQGRCRGG